MLYPANLTKKKRSELKKLQKFLREISPKLKGFDLTNTAEELDSALTSYFCAWEDIGFCAETCGIDRATLHRRLLERGLIEAY
jgi:hypothetical protein